MPEHKTKALKLVGFAAGLVIAIIGTAGFLNDVQSFQDGAAKFLIFLDQYGIRWILVIVGMALTSLSWF